MKNRRLVRVWLWSGVFMVFMQVILGGITRLTGSGLSITKWDIVTGTLPPLNQQEWNSEFELYKVTPQYQKINEGMSLPEFKFIYFWEYLHRLWARMIGFVFLIPFLVFAYKGWLERRLYRNLGIAVLLGAVVAAFGWIMVASGLVERPWVNAYKLTVHLNLALALYAWLIWITVDDTTKIPLRKSAKRTLNVITVLLIIQLLLGGLMSGMKACLYYPTWPDMHGEFFPNILINSELWTVQAIIEYEKGVMPGIVQFTHRMVAYLLFFGSILLWWQYGKSVKARLNPTLSFFLLVLLQMLLGVLTVLNCVGKIPLLYGVAHQAVAILLLSNLVYIHRKTHSESAHFQ